MCLVVFRTYVVVMMVGGCVIQYVYVCVCVSMCRMMYCLLLCMYVRVYVSGCMYVKYKYTHKYETNNCLCNVSVSMCMSVYCVDYVYIYVLCVYGKCNYVLYVYSAGSPNITFIGSRRRQAGVHQHVYAYTSFSEQSILLTFDMCHEKTQIGKLYKKKKRKL